MALVDIMVDVIEGFKNVERLDPEGEIYKRLCHILDKADDVALTSIYNANIKFASSLALNRMIQRGLITSV